MSKGRFEPISGKKNGQHGKRMTYYVQKRETITEKLQQMGFYFAIRREEASSEGTCRRNTTTNYTSKEKKRSFQTVREETTFWDSE